MKSNIKRTLAVILAVVFVALTFAACGSGGSNKKGNNGDTPEATEISVCLASEPATLDPALNSAVDGATLVSHLFSGLAKENNVRTEVSADDSDEAKSYVSFGGSAAAVQNEFEKKVLEQGDIF